MKPSPISDTSTKTHHLTPEQQERIRVRAYQLFEQRGCEDGHDFEDWLQAENEIMNVRSKRAAA